VRHDAKRDANESPIVKGLKQIGCSVHRLHAPLDLLVGFQGRTFLIEVKAERGPKGGGGGKLTPDQVKFLASWRGQHAIVRTLDEAFDVVLVKGGRDV
jgi:hypothetical protein